MISDLEGLRRAIAGSPTLARLLGIATERLDDDPGHDVEHALRVTLFTIRLGEGGIDVRHAVAAGLFHDLVNLPKDHPDRRLASEHSARDAAPILAGNGYDEAEVALVCDAIVDHSYSRGATPRSLLGRALQDADRLEALGVLGLFRTISTGTRMNARYFESNDPWGLARELDDRRYSVDHFTTKLLRLASTMCTEGGRVEAERRIARMQAMLEGLGEELGRPYVRHTSLG